MVFSSRGLILCHSRESGNPEVRSHWIKLDSCLRRNDTETEYGIPACAGMTRYTIRPGGLAEPVPHFRWFSPERALYCVIPAKAGIQRVTAAQAAVQHVIPAKAGIQRVIPAKAAVSVIPAKAGIQSFKAEGFDGVTAAKAGIQKSEVIGKNWIPACAGMTQKRNTGLLPRAGSDTEYGTAACAQEWPVVPFG